MPSVRITYCNQCRWLLRSAWYAQELLSTFGSELDDVALVPSSGGTFLIHLDGQCLWDRKVDGGFPEIKHLKQMVRNRIAPELDLGHIDRQSKDADET